MGHWLLVALLQALITSSAVGATVTFPSGLLKDFESDTPPAAGRRTERAAISEFIEESFPRSGPLEWRETKTLRDATHSHHLFQLYYDGRRVLDRFLDVHYNLGGWVQYATSSLSRSPDLSLPAGTDEKRAELRRRIEAEVTRAYGRFDAKLEIDPVIWMGRDGRGVPAFEVMLVTFEPTRHRHYIVAERDFSVLEQKRVARLADPSNKVFLSSPYPDQTSSPPTAVTIAGIDPSAGATLSSSFIHVLREQLPSGPSAVPVPQEVDPTHIYSDDAEFNDPAHRDPFDATSYDYTCYSTDPTQCPLQAFDAVNVFYHINNYRRRLKAYYDQIGSSPVFKSDPLTVLVNAMSVELTDSDGTKITTNNAAYVPKDCSKTLDRCLIFLRPEKRASTLCGDQAHFYDLAREAVVAVHEFQHYVTDMTTGIVSLSQPDVGDALHEGYSDYFGASHVSQEAARDITKVGEYAFKECPVVERDLGTVRVFPNDASDLDSHKSGLSWASGMWKLRQEFQPSPQTMDLIALKSQFFLSPTPGFVEAIEALVRADKSLFGGAHVQRIREMFYDEVKFMGSAQDGVFPDPGSHIAEVGFASCGATHAAGGSSFSALAATLAVLVAWCMGTLLAGRVYHTRSER